MPPLRSLLLSVLFVSLAVCQCGSTLHGKKTVEIVPVWNKGDAYVRLFREVGADRGFDQPWTFYEKEMREILLSLYFSRYQYFRWATSSRVFEEDRVNTLAPFFQRAFLEAGPDDVVEFYLPFRSSKLFGISGKTVITQGRAFIKDRKLNFQFFHLQEQVFDNDCEDCGDREMDVAWKLVPQHGQGYGPNDGSLDGDRKDSHWIVIDLSQAAAAAPPPPPAAVPAAGPDSQAPAKAEAAGGVEARFEELKKLLDRGLITQQDYERKKKELLDSL